MPCSILCITSILKRSCCAVPRFSETRPYQALPVQWSNHIEQATGELRHEEFLHKDMSDPRKVLAESLLESLGTGGVSVSIRRTNGLSWSGWPLRFRHSSRRSHASSVACGISTRLSKTITTIHAFGGSYSIKSVLPAMVPHLPMMIWRSKREAMLPVSTTAWSFVETDWVERATIEEALLALLRARHSWRWSSLGEALKEKAQMKGE